MASQNKKKCMTAKEVQEEFINMDIRKLRSFLNQYCSYKKIGKNYYYIRQEVEKLLLDSKNSFEYSIWWLNNRKDVTKWSFM